MFNSTILDVAIGVVFGFLAISLLTSAIVEGIASALKVRSRTLLAGIKALVNDPGFDGLAKKLYAHAAVNPRGATPLAKLPAYVDGRQFATAFLDVTGLSQAGAPFSIGSATEPAAPGTAGPDAIVADIQDPQLRQLLQGILRRSRGDVDAMERHLADWFDNAMDRVGGAYKRWAQLASFVVALALCILLNVDAIHLGARLWAQPTLADHLRILAASPSTLAPDGTGGDPEQARERAADAAVGYLTRNLPMGWPPGRYLQVRTVSGGKDAWVYAPASLEGWAMLPGWLLTAAATLFGAPFWFDLLQGFVRLKGSGPSPAEKAQGRSASA